LKQAIYYRSLTITISGVDGVGKTTVIQSILNNLPKLMRRDVVLLRHRPKFLPILSTLKYGNKAKAESLATEQAPSDAKNIGRNLAYPFVFLGVLQAIRY
jgi:GTPase SAR1 family protein